MGAPKAKKNVSGFAEPDFAFPKTVTKDARAELDKALRADDPGVALQALIQIVIADNLVSSDNAAQGGQLIDSVAVRLPDPYSGLAYLLEARLYRDIYSANSYLYNNRTLPLSPVPDNVGEWSRDMFSNKVCDLTQKAFQHSEKAKEMGFSNVSEIVTNAAEATALGLTLYDFMTMQAVGNLQDFAMSSADVLPFYIGEAKGNRKTEQNASDLISSILSANEKWHSTQGLTQVGAAMAAYRLERMEFDRRMAELELLIKEYGATPYAARFFIRLIDRSQPSSPKKYAEIYNLASDYLKRFPECRDRKALANSLENMCDVSFSAGIPSQSLPGKEIKGEVAVRNISDFYILAIKVKDALLEKNECNESDIINGKVSSCVKMQMGEASKPFYIKKDFSIPSLESGVYAIAYSSTPDKEGLITDFYSDSRFPLILVSRLSTLKSTDSKKKSGENQLLYVVDGGNQHPVSGATVKFIPAWKNAKWKAVSSVTDKDGMVAVPAGSYKVAIHSGKDIWLDHVYEHGYVGERKEILQGDLFTDLSIYHPGDSVRFSGVLYLSKGTVLKAAPEQEVKVILNDANYQPQDTLKLKSDRFGRLNGEFVLPSDGLLGSWSLQMNDNRNYISQKYFEVADYKSPTFYVAAEGTEGEVTPGETVKIRGEVKSYSGMPIADAEVKFNVKFIPWRRWQTGVSGNATYGSSVQSSGDGSFIIELPTVGLKDTPYAVGRFQLNITATNSAGETQEASPVSFSLGRAYRISADIAPYIKIGSEKMSPVKVGVYDMLDHPVSKKIYYNIVSLPDSLAIFSGEFESGNFPVDFSKLKSGKYSVLFSLNPELKKDSDNNEIYENTFIVWRPNEKKPPVETPLWLPEDQVIVNSSNSSDGKVRIRTGSSYPDSYLYAEIADMNGLYDRRWLKVSDGIIEIPVKVPNDDGRVRINLSGMHDLQGKQASVTLIPEIQTEGVKITAESFRDRLTPGAREEWKFRFSFNNKELGDLPVMSVMSNKALNALAPFQWAFDPYRSIYWNLGGEISGQSIGLRHWTCNPKKSLSVDVDGLPWPAWNTYGYPLYSYSGRDGFAGPIRVRGSRMMAKAGAVETVEEVSYDSDMAAAYQEAPVMMAEKKMAATNGSFYAKEESAEAEDLASGIEDGGAAQQEEPLREIECPLAFFMPELITDGEGVAAIDFDVPAFNGTWQLQVMGYTSDMRGSVLTKDAVASKPVMTQMNAPRFARTGDLLYLSATIFNNTAAEAMLGGKIIIFNPLTGENYVADDFAAEKVDAMGSRVITAQFKVPADIDLFGIKVYGKGEISSDGEQTIIPVYPSSQPVTESTTFYLAPGENSYSMNIPDERKDATLTLSYTDNPAWECITALPAMTSPDSNSALAQATALYGNAVASGLLKKYPKFAEALKLFADPANSADSTLVSNLQKNSALKIVALNNTPWVRNGASETLRMQRLTEYGDEEKSIKAIDDNIKALDALQNNDGGWSWCEGMQSSEWISMQVLRHFAMLKNVGFLPRKAEKMADKGFSFVDREIVKEWKKVGVKKYPYLSLLQYLYTRSSYGKVSASSDFVQIKARAIKEIAANWKKMNIFDKATAAMVIYREGNKPLAAVILKSLEEYSSSSKEKGVWFDNLKSGFSGQGLLLTTAQVLEAYNEIDPASAMIDGLRQWILLSKQTQDWGGGTAAADLVHSVLCSGTDWALSADAPEIFVGDIRIIPDRISLLTGSLTLPLTGYSGQLRIKRSAAGPAWGGVISQYVAPIAEVEAAKTPELSVVKNLYVITENADGTTASDAPLHKGDRVRVTLTLICDRDLEYVAVMDIRSASLEPAEQISGYTSSDGTWFYKEVRNSSTNLFIPFLSKGIHVISYDCFVDREGEYSLGIAEAQSQYAPVITAHSAGEVIVVK
ncbi:MAG: hypothetical protein K2G23_03960 [Muribaculaceae bacterium]|nr:hypothetical protein [Muribaculaceae bacterium]